MKFGQNLPRNQVPEWASSYIDYKALKKLIKSAQTDTADGEDADLAGFFYTLDRQLEDVDTFYNRKYAECSRRLRLLYDRYGMASKLKEGMEKDAMEDLMGTLLELRGQYRKLQWYGEVNRRGFVKITKKLDKKIESSNAQSRYLATKVDVKPFATNNKLTLDMRAINEWLSSLAEVKISDDASSVYSGGSGSLHRVTSASTLKLPPPALDSLDHAIREDHSMLLAELLRNNGIGASEKSHVKLLLDLLQRAVSGRRTDCVEFLLQQLPSIDEDDEINKRNCIHRLVISIGRSRALESSTDGHGLPDFSRNSAYITAAAAPVRAPGGYKVSEREPTNTLGKDDPSIKLLLFVLDHLRPEQRPALIGKDAYGRMALHYSAQYGLVAATQVLMRHIEQWKLLDPAEGIDSLLWQDTEGYAPLHLSVVGGHFRTTEALLHADNSQAPTEFKQTARKQVDKSGVCLALATKSNFHKIVRLLAEAGVDVNYQDQQGETALHIAARFGFEACAEALLEASRDRPANVELAEKTYGWTPLFIACVDGHFPIVKLLIKHHADANKADHSGWTPKEHAALRGHLDIGNLLAACTPPPSAKSPALVAKDAEVPPNATSLGDRRSKGVSKEITNGNGRVPEPIKSFGHRYLREQSMVLVSLGTMDTRKMIDAVSLEHIALADAHSTQLDTALSVVVSAHGATGDSTIIDLPIQENISTSPITFTTKDPAKVKLLFDLVPTYSGSTKKVIGRAVALLSSIRPNVGSKRMTLQGDLSVPLVAADTLDVIGSINFNFLIITPFSHPNMSITEDQTYWKSTSTMVIGHRGLGKNMAEKKSLQLGENTIQSFITAANLGASYVEFDVQLTKDHVPVIYHDFLVSETGVDAPVHTLTLEQFLAVNDSTPRHTRPPSPNDSVGLPNGNSRGRIQRSFSVGAPEEATRADMTERIKHTRDFKTKGFKGNSRGNFIQSPFTTLEEMFRKLPEHIGFNVEMKYPMLFESEDEGMDTYAVELNQFVDTVLTKVYDLGGKRNIIFSSFNPDICLLLSFKQPSIPILFLTDSGASAVGDIRASSLQEAIRFASRWNLLGIVSASQPLVMCPRLVKVVKESGLVCVSYGTQNNEPKNVKLQAQEGIDAVIVDSVLAVRKGLTDVEAFEENGTVTMNGAANGASDAFNAQT